VRKFLAILTLTLATVAFSASDASAQWRRGYRGGYATYTNLYTPVATWNTGYSGYNSPYYGSNYYGSNYYSGYSSYYPSYGGYYSNYNYNYYTPSYYGGTIYPTFNHPTFRNAGYPQYGYSWGW